ncbi:MAG: hypothetical protein WCJ49_06820 [Deltaproteobacteria bacterium]
MKHTPGPWEQQNHYVVSDRYERLQVIARCGGQEKDPLNWACHETDTENIANALLLASAPELLEACKLLIYSIEHEMEPHGRVADGIINARKAIAKAEGQEVPR